MTMTPREEALLRGVAETIRTHVRRAQDALRDELKEQALSIEVLRLGVEKLHSYEVVDFIPELKKQAEVLVQALPRAQDGRSVDPADVRTLVEHTVSSYILDFEKRAQETLQRAVDRMPTPKDGRDADIDTVLEQVLSKMHHAVEVGLAQFPVPVAKEPTEQQISHAVAQYLTANPPAQGKEAPAVTDAQLLNAVGVYIESTPSLLPQNGKDAPAVSDEQLSRVLQKYMAENPLPTPKDGASVTVEDFKPFLEVRLAEYALAFERRAYDVLQRSIERIPAPTNGRDGRDGVDADPSVVSGIIIDQLDLKASSRTNITKLCQELVAATVKDAVDKLPTPVGVTSQEIRDAVDQHLKENPIRVPEDGASVDVEDVEKVVQQQTALWALDFERRAQTILQSAVDKIPVAKDGVDGQDGADGKNGVDGVDGKDGFSPGDFTAVLGDDERTLKLSFNDGDKVRTASVHLRVPIYKQIWQEVDAYERDDIVTYGGSMWIALRATTTRPGSSQDWRLCVKSLRGRSDG